MIMHVLPGDSLSAKFAEADIDGDIVVFRECLVAGDISGEDLDEFWQLRANFLMLEFGGDPIDYQEGVVYEIERLLELGAGDEVNLWFEYELFCQANMWFCLDLMKASEAEIYRVAPKTPSPDNPWEGFATHDSSDLAGCLDGRVKMSREDRDVGIQLWQAFRERDPESLRKLGEFRSPAFPFLNEVCDAAAEIETLPEKIVADLKASGHSDIENVFPEFQKRAGVYGFGDRQVERLLERL